MSRIQLPVNGRTEFCYEGELDSDSGDYPPQLLHHVEIVDGAGDRIIHIYPNHIGQKLFLRCWVTDMRGSPIPDLLKHENQR